MWIGSFLKWLFGQTEKEKKSNKDDAHKDIDTRKIKKEIESTINEKLGINFDVDISLVGIDKNCKIYSLFFECDNCGFFQQLMFNQTILTCQKCGFSIINSGKSELKKEDIFYYIRENPNPQKILMGTYREVVPDTSIIGIRKAISKKQFINIHNNDTEQAIENLVSCCEDMENRYMQAGVIMPPRIYQEIAALFKSIGECEKEALVCDYFVKIAEFDKELAKKQNVKRITLNKARFFDEAKKIAKKHERLRKMTPRIDPSSFCYDKSPQKKSRPGSLAWQCADLGIPLTRIKCRWVNEYKKYDIGNGILIKRPEDVVMEILRADGYSGTSYEFAPYQILMKASCLDYVKECSRNIFLENAYSRTFSVQLDMYGMDKEKTSHIIKSIEWPTVEKNFNEIYQDPQVNEHLQKIEFTDISEVFNAITRKKFEQIVDFFLENPQDNSIGWPDIIACRENQLRMIEVKTTDKIRDSQYRMFALIKELLGVTVEVFQVGKIE